MSGITGTFKMGDMSASDALLRYGGAEAMRGKTMQETLHKVMGFWVSFAMAKVAKGNSGKIRKELAAIVTAYTKVSSYGTGQSSNLRTRKVRRAKAVDRWKGTLAARLVGMLNYKSARGSGHAAFYAAVGKFAASSAFSANLLRAGFRPAVSRLRNVKGAGRLPDFRKAAGRIKETTEAQAAGILVENWAKGNSPRSGGITTIAPSAFSMAYAEVEALLTKYYLADIKKAAKESGLTVDA